MRFRAHLVFSDKKISSDWPWNFSSNPLRFVIPDPIKNREIAFRLYALLTSKISFSNRQFSNRARPRQHWIDNHFSSGMMRTNYSLPRGFLHVHLYPASDAFALWSDAFDPGDSGFKYAGSTLVSSRKSSNLASRDGGFVVLYRKLGGYFADRMAN